jgi:hypothetical protein
MGRPADWAPLASSDPVPGDPAQVAVEASHLASIADEIQQQVARLRAISSDNTYLKGQYVDKLKSASDDVANSLQKVVGRYQKVSSALSKWVPELEYAQSESLKALQQAQDAYARQQQNQPPSSPPPNNGKPPTPQQKQAEQARQQAYNQASSDLAAARQRLDNVVSGRDHNGSARAGEIRHAIDDGVADSWWDQFKDFISKIAGLLKDVATVLEVIATILAVVALFIPGLDLIVILGIAVTAAALLIRTVLAATGNGSWVDVALDAFALLTFGAGKLVTSAMRATVTESKTIAQGLIDAERSATWLGKAGNLASQFGDYIDGIATKLPGPLLSKLSPLVTKFGDFVSGGGLALLEKASPSLAKVSEETTALERVLAGGEEESVVLQRTMNMIAARFGDVPDIAANMAKFSVQLNAARAIFGSAEFVDLGSKLAGGVDVYGLGNTPVAGVHIPVIGQWYGHLADRWTTEGGLW